MTVTRLLIINLLVLVIAGFVLLRFAEQPSRAASSSGVHGSTVVESVILPNTKVGNLDLSRMTVAEASELLQQYEERTTLVTFPHRASRITYADLGVHLDTALLHEYTRQCPRFSLTCRERKPSVPLDERIVVTDEEAFSSFVAGMNEEVRALLESIDISFDDLSVRAHGSGATIVVDEERLRAHLTAEAIISDDAIDLSTRVQYPDKEAQWAATEETVDAATASTLLIKYGRQPVYIPTDTLRSFFTVTADDAGRATGYVSREQIGAYITSLGETYPLDISVEHDEAILSIAYALLFRAGGEPPYTAVILPLEGESGTNGTYADKYLEINKSQQRMYAWENGKLVKTYIVGTGLTWETPAGDFQILRKEGTAISYTGNWFMPYYMPIGTVNGGYFFGFHEIPFKKDASGNITSRDVNTMGSPATGGCIQLYREDSLELYEWSDVGMPVLITD